MRWLCGGMHDGIGFDAVHDLKDFASVPDVQFMMVEGGEGVP